MNRKNLEILSQVFMGGSVISVVLSAIGFAGGDIWLASTQWLLVAAVLALFGIYIKMSNS